MSKFKYRNENGEFIELQEKLTTPIPTKTSDLINDSGFITSIPEEYVTDDELDTALQEVRDDIPTKTSELENDSGFITSIPEEYITDTELNAAIRGVRDDIPTKTSELTNDSDFVNKSYVDNADINLQGQIDAIISGSDVKDVVGTYAELQNYDTSSLGNKDIIKVLDDVTHNNARSYYRWIIGEIGSWVYVGSEAISYTKAETNELLNEKQDIIVDLEDIRSGAELGATALQTVPDTYRTAIDQDKIDRGKVDKIEGKGLSTNDYTNEDKAKVDSAVQPSDLEDYAKTEDVPTQLSQLSEDGTHRVVTDTEKTTWNAKQDAISDIDDIRDGAAAGAKAQPKLVSGENIKTINGKSILGNGNLEIKSVPKEVENAIETHGFGWTSLEEAEGIDITWDGDTTGMTLYIIGDVTAYRIADYSLSVEDLIGGVLAITESPEVTYYTELTEDNTLEATEGGGLVISVGGGYAASIPEPTIWYGTDLPVGVYFFKRFDENYPYVSRIYKNSRDIDIEWDGNTEGLTRYELPGNRTFYKISDETFPAEDFIGGIVSIFADGEMEVEEITDEYVTLESVSEEEGGGSFVFADCGILSALSEIPLFGLPTGTFFQKQDSGYVTHFHKEGVTQEIVHQIDPKYLPVYGGEVE